MTAPTSSTIARVLDRIEILRSMLRWASALDRDGIQRVLRQINDLREEIILSIGIERNDHLLIDKIEFRNRDKTSTSLSVSPSLRRQALLDRQFKFYGVFGINPKLLEILELIEKAAKTDLPILIEGESGTGKELLSKIIHANSNRSNEPLVSVNCGAIIPTLLESELFGHVKGAFTGAVKDRKGKFETAHNGTIFLDEIGEISQESQVKLLRVMETGEIQRVGSDETIYVRTRCIAATNRNLYQLVQKGNFREDLYYRLSVISVTLPPLRERRDELELLIGFFWKEAMEKLQRPSLQMSHRLKRFLMNHSYPGNIRELRNIIYRLVCIADDTADIIHLPETIRPQTLPEKFPLTSDNPLEQIRKQASDAAEKEYLMIKLSEVNGNVTDLAKTLGMNRSYLHTLLTKHGIRASEYKKM